MYDYSENDNEKQKFILNYDIDGNKIILHFATLNDKVIPYTTYNERKVLWQMEKQVSNISKIKKNINNKLYDLEMYKLGSIGKFIISLIGILVTIKLYSGMNIIIYLLGLFTSISMFLGISIIFKNNNIKKLQKEINELEKFEYFLNEKQEINNNIKSNKNILNNEIRKYATNPKTNNIALTINNIDKLSLEDLKRIRDMILLEKENETNNRKVYVKKR